MGWVHVSKFEILLNHGSTIPLWWQDWAIKTLHHQPPPPMKVDGVL